MIPLDNNTKRKLIWIGAMIAPLATVQFARLIDGPGPSAAPAATTEDQSPEGTPPATTTTAKPLTEAQKRAIAFVQNYQLPADLHSPMDAPDPVAAPNPEPTPGPPPTVAPQPKAPATNPLAGLTVSAIIGREGAAAAMIGHKLRRVSDEIVPGWTVKSIDPRKRHVTLVGPEGQEVVMAPPTPLE